MTHGESASAVIPDDEKLQKKQIIKNILILFIFSSFNIELMHKSLFIPEKTLNNRESY
jgi:hypothetical protein